MAVLGVVAAEERATEGFGLALILEPSRKRGMVLQGLELGLGERIVIRHLRSAQRAGHPEIGEELSRALARHRSSSIRVQGQEAGLDAIRGRGSMTKYARTARLSVGSGRFSRPYVVDPLQFFDPTPI